MTNYVGTQVQTMLNKFTPLSQEEELGYVIRAKRGDNVATNALINAQIPQIVFTAKPYVGKRCLIEDLVQLGCMGLLKAIKGFDIKLGTRFSTFSIYWIRAEITEYVHTNINIVGGSRKTVVTDVSFDTSVTVNGDNKFYETIAGNNNNDDEVFTKCESDDMISKLNDFNTMDAEAIRLYYIEKYDYRAIAKTLSAKYKHITAEWVRQRIKKGLVKMRERCQYKSLDELINGQK